jgi:polyhydroxybutyrate depolymerase
MPIRLLKILFLSLLGAFSLACTEDVSPPSAGAGTGQTGGSGTSLAGSGAGGMSGGAAAVAGNGGTGVLPTAGSGGAAPLGGNGSTAGGGGEATAGAGGSAGGPGGMGKSLGCGKQPTEEPHKYLQHDLVVNVAAAYQPKFVNRKYYTYLPNNYDPNKAYPLVFYGAGCGATGAESQPAMGVFNDDAILVFLLQVDGCFQAGSSGTADSPDIPYFDQALTEIENNYCIDQDRVFMSGYSSGAWFSITLSCSHGDKLRAIAVAAGGQQPALPTCTGPVAALFFVSSNDGGNPVAGPTGSGMARDRLLQENGCQMTTSDWDARWPSCKLYSGCEQNPVVWCDHMGGHSNGLGEKMANDGWWRFFTELP